MTAPAGRASIAAKDRFRSNDRYRAEREWRRFEGTPQRDLFRELRRRFLVRHPGPGPWVLDAGSGPGRFTEWVGPTVGRRGVALDIGHEMLRVLAEHWRAGTDSLPLPARVRGDAVRMPFRDASFGTVAAMGNLLGFAGRETDPLLGGLLRVLAPSGILLVEIAPGPGERSRYLARLPPRSVARLFRSPPRAVASRVGREGFRIEPRRRADTDEFHRIDAVDLGSRLEREGFRVDEIVAVAPLLGTDRDRIAAIAADSKAWGHLMEVEEIVGRSPDRWPNAAAVLIAATRGPAP